MIDLEQPLTDEQADVICERIAARVVSLGLATPAILFLEMHRPFARIAGQAVVVASPVLAPAFGLDGVGQFSRLVYHPGGLDRLLVAIETKANARPRKPSSREPGRQETQ